MSRDIDISKDIQVFLFNISIQFVFFFLKIMLPKLSLTSEGEQSIALPPTAILCNQGTQDQNNKGNIKQFLAYKISQEAVPIPVVTFFPVYYFLIKWRQ